MKTFIIACSVGIVIGLCGPGTAAHAAPARPLDAPTSGEILVVQAVPGARVDVSIDGKVSGRSAAPRSVLGPFRLSPGVHQLNFSGTGGVGRIMTRVRVGPGSSSDVVLHRPASVGGAPVVNTYRTPTKAIGPGKARLLLAHTATVTPADVEFDGKVVFTDIANGEFAEADVPAGSHKVALLPTGVKSPPILGPLQVTLAPRTVTMVYAVGNPKTNSMNVVVHTVGLAPDGSVVPNLIKTGSAGLAQQVRVVPFRTARAPDPAASAAVSVARSGSAAR